jgi:hypothetical protein
VISIAAPNRAALRAIGQSASYQVCLAPSVARRNGEHLEMARLFEVSGFFLTRITATASMISTAQAFA